MNTDKIFSKLEIEQKHIKEYYKIYYQEES